MSLMYHSRTPHVFLTTVSLSSDAEPGGGERGCLLPAPVLRHHAAGAPHAVGLHGAPNAAVDLLRCAITLSLAPFCTFRRCSLLRSCNLLFKFVSPAMMMHAGGRPGAPHVVLDQLRFVASSCNASWLHGDPAVASCFFLFLPVKAMLAAPLYGAAARSSTAVLKDIYRMMSITDAIMLLVWHCRHAHGCLL